VGVEQRLVRFDAFVYNRTATECYVTVGGEPVNPEVKVSAE
jgi:hypothetical protein